MRRLDKSCITLIIPHLKNFPNKKGNLADTVIVSVSLQNFLTLLQGH